MVAYPRQRLNLPIAGAAGAATALLVAVGFALMPVHLIESAVMASGLPKLMGSAHPPLGATARALLCFGGSVGAGAAVMILLGVLIGDRTIALGCKHEDREEDSYERVPTVRRADAHPDAPPRPPVIATRELGAPLMSVGAEHAESADEERPLPDDLDTPLVEYDRQAFIDACPPPPIARDEAPEAVVAPAPLPRPATFDPGERFETFALAPPPAKQPPTLSHVDTVSSVHVLLDRLEAGVARRAGERPVDGNSRLDVAMESLRRLAMAG